MGDQDVRQSKRRRVRIPVLKPAFTLIELLVVIGVVGILIGLLLPALWGAKLASEKAVTLANLRQTHTTFEFYTQRYNETYPWFDGNSLIPLSPPDEPGSAIGPGYWDLEFYWVGLMHEVAPWREHFESWLDGGARRGNPPWTAEDGNYNSITGLSSFRYCRSFMARPELWRTDAVEDDRLYRPVRLSDVAAPSSKVLLYDWELSYLRNNPDADRDLVPMVFADGHATVHRVSEAADPVAPTWVRPEPEPLHDTPNGVRGRDY